MRPPNAYCYRRSRYLSRFGYFALCRLKNSLPTAEGGLFGSFDSYYKQVGQATVIAFILTTAAAASLTSMCLNQCILKFERAEPKLTSGDVLCLGHYSLLIKLNIFKINKNPHSKKYFWQISCYSIKHILFSLIWICLFSNGDYRIW